MKQSELAECDDELVYRVVELLFKERGQRGARLKNAKVAAVATAAELLE